MGRGVVSTVLVLLLLTTHASAKDPDVSLRLTPNVGTAPSTVILHITIEPHDGNRVFCVGAFEPGTDGPTRSTCEDLNGSRSPRFRQVEWRDMREGDYQVVVRVGRIEQGKEIVLSSVPQSLKLLEAFPGR